MRTADNAGDFWFPIMIFTTGENAPSKTIHFWSFILLWKKGKNVKYTTYIFLLVHVALQVEQRLLCVLLPVESCGNLMHKVVLRLLCARCCHNFQQEGYTPNNVVQLEVTQHCGKTVADISRSFNTDWKKVPNLHTELSALAVLGNSQSRYEMPRVTT